jgi:Cupin/Helix-turn-helix domain
MSQDTLSDVLRGVRLRGAMFFNVSARNEWAAEAPAARELAPLMMRGVDHGNEYHALARGSCWAGTLDGPSVQLLAGDVVMFPHRDAHVLSSTPGMRGNLDFSWFAETRVDQLPLNVAYDGQSVSLSAPPDSHAQTSFVCGFLGCDVQPFNPLIAALHERFAALIGVPPMQYLAQWRTQAAARRLLETRSTVASIAVDVGYDSEAAFARAFKRSVGKPPAAWRRERDEAKGQANLRG